MSVSKVGHGRPQVPYLVLNALASAVLNRTLALSARSAPMGTRSFGRSILRAIQVRVPEAWKLTPAWPGADRAPRHTREDVADDLQRRRHRRLQRRSELTGNVVA
eukprot:scaffold1085_cov407-Prasinococcus_capsulatus_cf.AAC.85